MTGVTYQANSDRPLSGVPRIDCMCEILFAMTRTDLRELPACMVDDWISGTCRCINAIPGLHHKAAWARVFAKQLAGCFRGQTENEFVAALADRLADEREAWAQEKLMRYPELTR